MIKQDYITIKELGKKLDECDINMLISYVNKAVKHMEVISASENDIINANNIRCNEKVSKVLSNNDETEYDIEVTDKQIDLWESRESKESEKWWMPYSSEFFGGFEIKRELKVKGVILYFILKALKKKGMADVKQISLKNAIDNKNMGKLESRIEEFAARLLIPKSFFSNELGKDIVRMMRDERNEIVDIEMERNIILAKLQSFGVSETMAKLRLKIASFGGEYDSYTEKPYLDDFTYYYDDIHNEKDSAKEMKK